MSSKIINTPYVDYYKNHSSYHNSIETDEDIFCIYKMSLLTNIGTLLEGLPRDIPILEIGCGQGYFTRICRELGYTNYIGFDLDIQSITKNKEIFEEYSFYDTNVSIHLQQNPDTVGLIFMSHVMEHIPIVDAIELARDIGRALTDEGIWINIMPNAGAIFGSTLGRYADITHSTLYSSSSFSQLLLQAGFQHANIEHRNTIFRIFIFQIWQLLFRFLYKMLCRTLGYLVDNIGTFEIVSIIRK